MHLVPLIRLTNCTMPSPLKVHIHNCLWQPWCLVSSLKCKMNSHRKNWNTHMTKHSTLSPRRTWYICDGNTVCRLWQWAFGSAAPALFTGSLQWQSWQKSLKSALSRIHFTIHNSGKKKVKKECCGSATSLHVMTCREICFLLQL